MKRVSSRRNILRGGFRSPLRSSSNRPGGFLPPGNSRFQHHLHRAAILAALLLVYGLWPSALRSASAGKTPPVVQTGSFGPMAVHGSAMMRFALPMRLSIPRALALRGYGVTAVCNFTFVPSSGGTGGKSVTPADIGVGFPGLSATLAGDAVTTAQGFDYDPSLIEPINGKSPFTGALSGRATLADLMSGREVFRVGRHSGARGGATEDLDFPIKIAVKPQYFTPGTFSGTITLSITQ